MYLLNCNYYILLFKFCHSFVSVDKRCIFCILANSNFCKLIRVVSSKIRPSNRVNLSRGFLKSHVKLIALTEAVISHHFSMNRFAKISCFFLHAGPITLHAWCSCHMTVLRFFLRLSLLSRDFIACLGQTDA